MFSRISLLLLPRSLRAGLFAFSQTSLAEETTVQGLSDGDNDLGDAEATPRAVLRGTHKHVRAAHTAADESTRSAEMVNVVREYGRRRLDSAAALTLAPVSQTAESEPVVVQGFYIDPPAYPALPEVEGTRINSGRKLRL